MRYFFSVIALFGVACNTGQTMTAAYTCSTDSTPLALDSTSSLGFTGEEAVARAQERFATVEVEWTQAVAAPEEETFYFSFGSPITAEEVSALDCGGRTWVSVEVPVEIASASGQLSASDTVEVRGTLDADGALQVFVTWPDDEIRMNSTVTGAYADAAEAHDDGLTLAHLSVYAHGFVSDRDPLAQGITVGGEYDNAQAASSASLYACGPDGDRSGDCLTLSE